MLSRLVVKKRAKARPNKSNRGEETEAPNHSRLSGSHENTSIKEPKGEEKSPVLRCEQCFGEEDQRRARASNPKLISNLDKGLKSCYGCKLLRQAIDACEAKTNQQFDDMVISLSYNAKQFSTCQLHSETGSSFELLFGHNAPKDNHSPTRDLGYLPQSIDKFLTKAAREWINLCLKSHIPCRIKGEASLPRRVIDIGQREVFLYESHGETRPYAALSHCWEDSQPLRTTSVNLPFHLGRLAWHDLPLAFQECIEFVRSLDIRYLWIDSLCIVQDNETEWATESGRMANIYENAIVTLALHQAGPNMTSFPKIVHQFTIPYASPNLEIQFYLREVFGYGQDANIDRSRLSSRGWCFQERLLSTHIIHCLPNGVIFECTEHEEACNCVSTEPHAHYEGKFKTIFTDEISHADWRRIVELYTQKELTYHKDCLPALSGITNRVREAGNYYGGIWQNHLPLDLLWFTNTSASETQTNRPPVHSYTAPSFLWANIDGNISFVNGIMEFHAFKQTFSVMDVQCKPAGGREDTLGELSGGALKLKGSTCRATFVHCFEQMMAADFFMPQVRPGLKCHWATLKCVEGGHYIFHPDSLHMPMDGDLICIKLFEATEKTDLRCYALVLRAFASLSAEISYCWRIGICGTLPKDIFGPNETEIVIE